MSRFSEEIETIAQAARCGAQDWSQMWGDPAVIAGPLMVGYALLGWGLVRVVRLCSGREKHLIILCCVLVFAQLINTPLDLHAFVWTFGRCLSHAQGWYEARRTVQVGALVFMAVFFIFLLSTLLIYFRKHLISNLAIVTGVALAVGCALVVAVSLHHLQHLLSGSFGPFRADDLVEASGIVIAGSGVWLRIRASRRRKLL